MRISTRSEENGNKDKGERAKEVGDVDKCLVKVLLMEDPDFIHTVEGPEGSPPTCRRILSATGEMTRRRSWQRGGLVFLLSAAPQAILLICS